MTRVVEDIYPDRGPLGGIHAALSATTTDLNLMLAVDMPFMRADFLRYLVEQARATAALVVVPHIGNGLQPLCAVYRRSFRERAEMALRAGQNKIDPLFTPSETCVLNDAELQRLSFPATMFENLNTREEWERARQT
jgi:molybdopterin-guanine dinucleotide biosynthesis protein A